MESLDFGAFFTGKFVFADLVRGLSYQDLRVRTKEFFAVVQDILATASDADITFVPTDPHASTGDEVGWTAGHVIAHLTAIFEERAATAAMQARVVQVEGRLLYETPWQQLQTVRQVQQRLNESQRIVTALLNVWPDTPHLEITLTPVPLFGPLDALKMHALGIIHGQTHFEQLREALRQAQAIKN